jgi:DNA repair exonuclease SbcCD nuclease subunit
MLFIGDIHITSKHSWVLLTQIREVVDKNPEEQHLIFLWDYVYHFSYDRKALLQLFSLFIELATQGKTLYIVAGNHDRIAGHFVFEEARQTLLFTGSTHIHFITSLRHTTIEWVECLFLPFYHPEKADVADDTFPELREETHPQRRVSRQINNILAQEIAYREQHKTTDRLLLIHHRYIAKTKFPGQQALFGYENPALHPWFLDNPAIRAISWHLHEPFCFKQYLCTGSMRHTSPLEINQQKFAYVLDAQEWQMSAYPLRYNPYLQLPYPTTPLQKIDIDMLIEQNSHRMHEQLTAGNRPITTTSREDHDLTYATITITTTEQTVQDLPDAFVPELLQEIWTIKHKLIHHTELSLLNELDRASLDLTTRFSDWKVLLRRFLEQKYGNQADRYLHLLEEEKLL